MRFLSPLLSKHLQKSRCLYSVFVPATYGSKERRVDIDALLFVGDEESSASWTERLRSSAARQGDEVCEASIRRRARDEKLLSEAHAALASAQRVEGE
jgi:hypothetical protein